MQNRQISVGAIHGSRRHNFMAAQTLCVTALLSVLLSRVSTVSLQYHLHITVTPFCFQTLWRVKYRCTALTAVSTERER
ncbi:hypothetical protein F5Y08DRAFT_300809 [Xylaria arbuscula]|nr:hypothetical protein F5Y08DRAFT_300809 [Xylaria arbuscula]